MGATYGPDDGSRHGRHRCISASPPGCRRSGRSRTRSPRAARRATLGLDECRELRAHQRQRVARSGGSVGASPGRSSTTYSTPYNASSQGGSCRCATNPRSARPPTRREPSARRQVRGRQRSRRPRQVPVRAEPPGPARREAARKQALGRTPPASRHGDYALHKPTTAGLHPHRPRLDPRLMQVSAFRGRLLG